MGKTGFEEMQTTPWRRNAALFIISQGISLFGSSIVQMAIFSDYTRFLVCDIDYGPDYNLEYMNIDNFRRGKEEKAQRLQIKYSSRVFIDNTVIKLCCFNQLGECKLNLAEPINSDISDYMPEYLVDIHKELQDLFASIKKLNELSPEELNLVLNSNMAPRLISLNQYEIDGDVVDFGFRRVCRMNRTYVLYLYKLFLEYRGRHPFESINLTRHYSLEAEVIEGTNDSLPFDVILSTNRNTNRNNIKKLDRMIKSKNIEELVKSVYSKDIKVKGEKYIVVNKNPFILECENNLKIEIIKKLHNQISITLK